MEPFYNQNWFWMGLFTVIASIGAVLIKEIITSRSQIQIEKLKIYDSSIFLAHKKLYEFISAAYNMLWPPNDPVHDFQELMKNIYFGSIKDNMLFYAEDIRKILESLEAQYLCMRDPDLIPEKPFDKFYQDDLSDSLYKLDKLVYQKTGKIIPKTK